MESYVEAWKTSSHADVTCTDCHFPPGIKSKIKGKFTAASMVVNYFTGVYKKSKPWAEISDKSCLRSGCHAERLLKDKVEFKEGIIFGHKPHLMQLRRGKKLRCTSCHSQIVQGEHISVTESTCFLCHFKNTPDTAPINDCTWCHDAPVRTGDEQVVYDHTYVKEHKIDCVKCHGSMQVGDGAVPRERCSSCHAEIGKINQYDDTDFIHKNHITDHKVECQNCHLGIQHKSVATTADIMPECQSCHTGTHSLQFKLFSGKAVTTLPSHPNPMFKAGLNCQACHIYHEPLTEKITGEEIVVAKGESCEKCHGEGYAHLFSLWKTAMAKKLEKVNTSLTRVRNEFANREKSMTENNVRSVSSLIDRAGYNYAIVKEGNVVHNVAYSDELLAQASEDLHSAVKEMNSSISIPDVSLERSVIPSDCQNCHEGIDAIEVNIYNVTFTHGMHIQQSDIDCFNCHSNATEHGQLIATEDKCSNCHHIQKSELSCNHCHETQSRVFSGEAAWLENPLPDIMWDAGLECSSCHYDEDTGVQHPTGETCNMCHGDGYGEILTMWQEDIQGQVQSIEQDLQQIESGETTELIRGELLIMQEGIMKIKHDGSSGAHNYSAILETLEHYQAMIQRILDQQES